MTDVILLGSWRGRLVAEGPEVSVIRITEGPRELVGQSLCYPNSHFERVTEGGNKRTGPGKRGEYAGAGKNQEAFMPDDTVDYKTEYNKLVEEAISIGLTEFKPIGVNFRDPETGAKRCEALAEAIEAHRAKVPPQTAAPAGAPATNQEKRKMSKTSTAKKPAAKKAAAKKAVAPAKAAKTNSVRTGIVAEFGTREKTNKEALLLALWAKKNKPVPTIDLIKAVYGKADQEQVVALKMVLLGLEVAIEENKLPYKIVREGRADEATITLATKSGR